MIWFSDIGLPIVRLVAHFLGHGSHYLGEIQIIISQRGTLSQGVLSVRGSLPV